MKRKTRKKQSQSAKHSFKWLVGVVIIVILAVAGWWLAVKPMAGDRVCEDGICVITHYAKDGQKDKRIACEKGRFGICNEIKENVYDAQGRRISSKECHKNVLGKCKQSSGQETFYDKQGYLSSQKQCMQYNAQGVCEKYGQASFWTYTDKGNMRTSRTCNYNEQGVCEETDYSIYDYVFNDRGRLVKSLQCSDFLPDGLCALFGRGTEYTYLSNGAQSSSRECKRYNEQGICEEYGGGNMQVYDDSGRKIFDYNCLEYNEDGSCAKIGRTWEGYYGPQGYQTAERYCMAYDDNKICTLYDSIYEYLYTDDGRTLQRQGCRDEWVKGNRCRSYDSGWKYMYDSKGEQLAVLQCDLDPKTGACMRRDVSLN